MVMCSDFSGGRVQLPVYTGQGVKPLMKDVLLFSRASRGTPKGNIVVTEDVAYFAFGLVCREDKKGDVKKDREKNDP